MCALQGGAPLNKISKDVLSNGMHIFLCVRGNSAIVVIALILQLVSCEWLTHPSLEQYSALQRTPSPMSKDALHIRFFGTTTLQVDDGQTAIMIDGFFSRPSVSRLALSYIAPNLASIGPNQKRIVTALNRGNVTNLAAVLVSHSHYDHALDSAFVACRTNAVLVGSQSTANIARGQGLPEVQIFTPAVNQTLRFGKFLVDVFDSLHSLPPRFQGTINEVLAPPASVNDYKEGGTYSFLIRHEWGTILIHSSAHFIPEMFRGVHADVVFLSIGSLGKQQKDFASRYWREVVGATEPALVVPIHWDDFFRPLDYPLIPMPFFGDKFTSGMDMVLEMANASNIRLELLPPFEAFDIKKSEVRTRRQKKLEGRPEKLFETAVDPMTSCHSAPE